MSRYLKYVFPVADTSAVCLTQATAGAASLALNGNLSNPINSQVSFIDHGFIRQVSVTSTANLAARTITVTGLQNGVVVTEDITGPNNTTVYGGAAISYDVITSVTIDGAAANIRVGTGYHGYFPLVGINLETAVVNYTLNTASVSGGNIPTAILNTSDNILQNGLTYASNVTNNNNVFTIKASAGEAQYRLPAAELWLCKALLVQINGTAGTVANSISMTFIQV